jgi:hypothetical protein
MGGAALLLGGAHRAPQLRVHNWGWRRRARLLCLHDAGSPGGSPVDRAAAARPRIRRRAVFAAAGFAAAAPPRYARPQAAPAGGAATARPSMRGH